MNQNIDNLLKEVSGCTRCPNLKPWKKFASGVHGNINPSAMIVSEAPGTKSILRGKFWMGQAGRRIRKVLSGFGVELEDIFYLTDTVKCCPPNDRTPYPDELENCKGFLTCEIQILKPKYIVVFGKVALFYFLSNFAPKSPLTFQSMNEVQNDYGYKMIEFDTFTLIPLLHPSRANQFMTYDIYKRHLFEVFALIIESKTTDDDTTSEQNVV
jgi:uracil-DNA glycosylase